MRLVTFRTDGGPRLGVLRNGDEVVELDEPRDMLTLIDSGQDGLVRAKAALGSPKSRAHRLDGLELLPPLPEPRGNVIAIGRNYQKHAEETAMGHEPSPPTVFTKAITSLTEPFADIAIDRSVSDKIDWEVELAVVIGRRGVNIRRAQARPHVFGYMALNDVKA